MNKPKMCWWANCYQGNRLKVSQRDPNKVVQGSENVYYREKNDKCFRSKCYQRKFDLI